MYIGEGHKTRVETEREITRKRKRKNMHEVHREEAKDEKEGDELRRTT
jgi:hypothetical protein